MNSSTTNHYRSYDKNSLPKHFHSTNDLIHFSYFMHSYSIWKSSSNTPHCRHKTVSTRPNLASLHRKASCPERNCVTYLFGEIQEARRKHLVSGKRSCPSSITSHLACHKSNPCSSIFRIFSEVNSSNILAA